MFTKHKIRVLIVDDSLIVREMLSRGLAKDPDIEIAGTASDPLEARDKIIALKPDVMTLDIEMPKMNGIDFLSQLMPQYPIPVIVVSSVGEHVFDALNAGAVDFFTKSDLINERNELQLDELVIKLKTASTAKVGFHKPQKLIIEPKQALGQLPEQTHDKAGKIRTYGDVHVVAMGASIGGAEAIASILRQLSRDIPGILIAQHMPPKFTKMYAARLNNSCAMEVREAQNGDRVLPGRVLIAPGDYHMRLKKDDHNYFVECFKGEKVNGHCPSIDVLFDSVAQYTGKNAIGIILTGMGADGAVSLLHMRQNGAHTIGQDEESCVVYGMPKAAFELGAVEKQISLNNIPLIIQSLIKE